MTIDEAIQSAIDHHQSGRFSQAEAIYRQVLAANPNHAEATHLLGIIAHQHGRDDDAAKLVQHAISLSPDNAQYFSNLSLILRNLGEIPKAIDAARGAIAVDPRYADGWFHLGCALAIQEKFEEAAECYRRAILIKSDYADAWNNLATCLKDQNKTHDAIAAFERAARINPNFAEAWHGLGSVYLELEDIDRAMMYCKKAIAIRPALAESHYNLGICFQKKGDFAAAHDCYRAAIDAKPDCAEALNNFGNMLIKLHPESSTERVRAIEYFQQAIARKPDLIEAHGNMGFALHEVGPLDDAMVCYERALAIQEDYAPIRWNRSLALLAKGNFRKGWADYEFRDGVNTNSTRPRWDGSPLDGRTILLTTEQGYGDVIQLVRYLPLVIQRGGKVVLECRAALRRLVESIDGVRVVVVGETVPDHDVQCPLMSLPLVFGTELETIPARVPYVHAEPAKVAAWERRLGADRRLKVGLAWAGDPSNQNDRQRSMRLAFLEPLAAVPGVRFISLQKGPAAAQIEEVTALDVIDYTNELADFSDTAGLIANLDLVIAVDTSVAHLAGALAKNIWTLIPAAPDWRWLLERSDSPWYPTMTLFRQETMGDWAGVVGRVAGELRKRIDSTG